MLPALRKSIPQAFNRYIEPMVGGGALFWDLAAKGLLRGKDVILADTNEWLMRTYGMVRDAPDDLLEVCRELEAEYYKRPEEFYYEVRAAWNAGEQSSARFIFLKQTSFNGLWRYNKAGLVNMPWGKYKNPRIADSQMLHSCSRALEGVELRLGDYAALEPSLEHGDFVYFDPPYHRTFDAYSAASFTGVHHVNLVHHCAQLTARGVHVAYTHQESPEVWGWLDNLWTHATVIPVAARRVVNSNGHGRTPVMDLLVTSSTAERARRAQAA